MIEFLKTLKKEISEDNVGEFAASLSFKGLFCVFPFFVLMVSLLGLFDARNLVEDSMDTLSKTVPADVVEVLEDNVLALVESENENLLSFGAAFSVALALWAVSGAFRSIITSMNIMYDVKDDRGFLKVYWMSALLALGAIVLFGGALGVVMLASSLGFLVKLIAWPLLLALVMLGFSLIYYFAPNIDQRFKWITPGSVFATLSWLIFSLLFSLYVDSFGSYNETYGALAGVVVFMLYSYYSAFILLVGAQINQIKMPVEGKAKRWWG